MNKNELTDYQNETIKTLDEEYEKQWEVCQREMDKLSHISSAKARFLTQCLLSQTKWKLEDRN